MTGEGTDVETVLNLRLLVFARFLSTPRRLAAHSPIAAASRGLWIVWHAYVPWWASADFLVLIYAVRPQLRPELEQETGEDGDN